MGEYIRYKESEIKIGTCEDLYYTSYQKYNQALNNGRISEVPGNGHPSEYAKPNSGFRFRFPFPDEDKLPFGEIGKFHHHRGVPVKIEPPKEHDANEEWQVIAGKDFRLEITQQKLVHRESDGMLCLALVVRNPDSDLSFRIEDDPSIKKIVQDIVRNHVVRTANTEERNFYRTIASRIRDGFRLQLSARNTRHQSAGKIPRLRRHGKGLR